MRLSCDLAMLHKLPGLLGVECRVGGMSGVGQVSEGRVIGMESVLTCMYLYPAASINCN